jgi:hypothetical protein
MMNTTVPGKLQEDPNCNAKLALTRREFPRHITDWNVMGNKKMSAEIFQ